MAAEWAVKHKFVIDITIPLTSCRSACEHAANPPVMAKTLIQFDPNSAYSYCKIPEFAYFGPILSKNTVRVHVFVSTYHIFMWNIFMCIAIIAIPRFWLAFGQRNYAPPFPEFLHKP